MTQTTTVDDETTNDSAINGLVIGRQPEPFPVQVPETKAVVGWKGGIGKTTLANELAYLDNGVAGDMDWTRGGLTKAWGYDERERLGAPLIEAFESGKIPQPLRGGPRKPDLIPGHSTFGDHQPEAQKVRDELIRWADELKRKVTWDTHPDACPSTHGALAAARVIVVPTILRVKEMEALEQLLEDISDYPLLLIPYMVPPSVPTAEKNKLVELSRKFNVPVGPMVSRYDWIGNRKKRVAICSEPVFKKERAFVDQMLLVHEAVTRYGQ